MGPRLRGDDSCECGAAGAYLTRLALLQLFSDVQTPRDRRKQSTGVEHPSASKRCSSTPLHWNPHFSSTLREAGLVTRAPAWIWSSPNSSKKKSMTRSEERRVGKECRYRRRACHRIKEEQRE